jgi:putative membrane protein insertion efficiency factor
MKKIVVALLRGYKWVLSPLLPAACRYVPSCSEYAMEAVEHYGVLLGGTKAVWRVLRCHPFACGGYDPVLTHHAGIHEINCRHHAN